MKHTSKCFLWALAWSCTIAPLAAQQTYTLDECIENALHNNARIQNAKNDLGMAEQQRQAAFTKYFPTVSATGMGFMADKDLLRMDVAPGMSMKLLKNGLMGGVNASLPLFAGGQIVQGNQLAKVNVEKYRLLGRQAENEVRLTAEQYFWQVAMLKEKLRTLGVVESQLAEIHKDVDAAVSAGITNRNDLLQVQLRQNDTRSTRINVENALALSRRLLAQYIGTPGDSVDVAFQVADSLPPSPLDLYRAPEYSLVLTPEYNLLQAQLKASRIERKMSVGRNLPTVAIGGGFMHDNLSDRNKPFWMGFATVSIPLQHPPERLVGGQPRHEACPPGRAQQRKQPARRQRTAYHQYAEHVERRDRRLQAGADSHRVHRPGCGEPLPADRLLPCRHLHHERPARSADSLPAEPRQVCRELCAI